MYISNEKIHWRWISLLFQIQVQIPKIPSVAKWLSYEPNPEEMEVTSIPTQAAVSDLDEPFDKEDRSIRHWLKHIKQQVEEESVVCYLWY